MEHRSRILDILQRLFSSRTDIEPICKPIQWTVYLCVLISPRCSCTLTWTTCRTIVTAETSISFEQFDAECTARIGNSRIRVTIFSLHETSYCTFYVVIRISRLELLDRQSIIFWKSRMFVHLLFNRDCVYTCLSISVINLVLFCEFFELFLSIQYILHVIPCSSFVFAPSVFSSLRATPVNNGELVIFHG